MALRPAHSFSPVSAVPQAEDLSADDLVRRVRGGETAYYEQIVRRYQGAVFAVVNTLLADRATAEDLVQQIFVKAYFALDQYRMGEGLGRWLVGGIARNAALQELRTRRRRLHHLAEYGRWAEQRLEDAGQVDLNERLDKLRACLRKLDEPGRDLVRQRYLQQKSLEEIAREAGRSMDAVRNHLLRLRRQLRQCIESQEVTA